MSLGLRSQFSNFGSMGSGTQFPDPFLDIASLAVPTNMRSALFWCLPRNTLIEMADFSVKPIETVSPGDVVRNKNGGTGTVVRCSRREHSEDLVTLQYGGFGNTSPHRMTADHKVWLTTESGCVRVPAKDVREGDLVATPVPACVAKRPPRFSGWLLGLYTAEGCYIKDGERRLGVRFTLGRDDETSGVLPKLLTAVAEQIDQAVDAYTPLSRPDVRLVTVNDPELPDWLYAHAGQYSKGKQFSGAVLEYGPDFVLDLVAGWIDGDGWASPQGLNLTTASKALAVQIVRLANAVGMTPSSREVQNDKGFGAADSVAWQIQFGRRDVDRMRGKCLKADLVEPANNPARPRYQLDSGFVVRPVVAVGREAYSGDVFNFEVSGDHSYIADGVSTSNCEYIFSMFGTYRMATERVVSYFLTDVELVDASEDETEKWDAFLNDTLDVKTVVQSNLRNRACFQGDTRVITLNGVFPIRELAGRKAYTLSSGGAYRLAEFKSFGRQELLEVTFSDGRTVLATPEHEWLVRNCSGSDVRVPTTSLCRGHGIERTVAARPEKNDKFYEGVRHGFTFGDGTRVNGGRQTVALFFGDKDAEMLKHFAGHGRPPKPWPGRNAVRVHGLPPHYKTLPETTESASYWYGFVCGFLAADGSVDTHGCAILTQKAKTTLEVIAEQLPRIGMCAGPVRGHLRTADLSKYNHTSGVYTSKMHYVTLLKRFMTADDFLLSKHREKFLSRDGSDVYGRFVAVKSVRRTGIVDDVFCCVEPETHTFVIGNGVVTGNCYGNSFSSVVRPFVRFLVCPKCGYMAPLREVHGNKAFNFKYAPGEPDEAFRATCPACKVGTGYSGPWKIKDEDDDNEKKLRVKVWNPHEIEILHDSYTDEVAYLWRIPEDYKRQLRTSQDGRGNLFMLERAPKEVLRAIARNQIYRFHPDAVFHMKEPTLAGVYNRGWGLPRIISNFRQIWYVQVLRRYNEAIALDYVIPFRIITPAPAQGKTGGGLAMDPMSMYNGSDFRGQVMSMIRRRRRDPASLQVLPFPVNFQMFGADANQLAPRDLLDQGMETLLNDAGTPIELYNGSLQLQTAPVALRLFESTWHHLVHDANAFLSWLVRQVSQIMSWETVTAKLKRVTIADNLEKQMMAAQLMMSQQLSAGTVLGDLGYSWKKEQRNIADESRYQSELQTRTQEEMEQAGFAQQIAKGQGGGDPAAQGGATAQGGAGGVMPGMGGGQGPVTAYLSQMSPNVPQSPQDMMQVADSLAQELMGLPDAVKNSELRKLKQYNQALHAMVKARIDQIRSDTKSQAGNQAVGQMQMQAQGGQPPM